MNKLKKDTILYYLFSFLVGFYLANGTTVLFAQALGFSYSRIFILGAFYMLMFVIFEVPSGAMADLIGRKKSIVVGCVVLAIAAILTGMSNTFTQVFFSFFIWSLGFSFISGADEALLYDRINDQSRYPKILGRAHFFALIGTALAGILGPILFSENFRYPYLSSAVPFFLGGLVMVFFKEDYAKKFFTISNHWEQIKTGIRLARQNKYILWATATMSLAFAVWYNLSNSYQPFLRNVGFSIKAFSIILPGLFLSEALGGMVAGKFAGYFGERQTFGITFLGIALALGLAGYFAVRATVGLLLLYCFFLGVLRPVISAYTNRHIESSHRATVISTQAMVATITAAGTLFLFGFLTDRIGILHLLSVLGGLVFITSLILLGVKPRD